MNELSKQFGYLGYYHAWEYAFIGFVTNIQIIDNKTTTLYANWIFKHD